jgi:integrase/recombinase XerD
MKVPVQLYVRARLEDGSYPYLKAAMLPNGHVRPGYAINSGRAVKIVNGVYQLRYRRDGKRVWEAVGTEADVALLRLRKKIREFEDAELCPPPTPVAAPAHPLHLPTVVQKRPLATCITKYLTEIKEHREPKTYAAYRSGLLSFACDLFANKDDLTLESLGKLTSEMFIEDLNRDHALAWIAALRRGGNQPRTLYNRAHNLNIFMHHFGLPSLLNKKDKPKFTEKKVRAYNQVELAKMFDAASEDEADLLYFLLCTGARDGDASFACWTDLDLVAKSYTVTEHLDLGYRPKDKEEGSLPIPDLLVERMMARRKRYPKTRLIFETSKGKPECHMLRIIKSLALRAGVNCGECLNRKGKSCAKHPVCKHAVLHKMRKTFATTVHHNGMPAKTVQRYLRHSDLNSTLRYLADQPEEQVRSTINSTFVAGGISARSAA